MTEETDQPKQSPSALAKTVMGMPEKKQFISDIHNTLNLAGFIAGFSSTVNPELYENEEGSPDFNKDLWELVIAKHPKALCAYYSRCGDIAIVEAAFIKYTVHMTTFETVGYTPTLYA